MNDGYIKLFRKTLDNPVICKDSDHLAVWVYFLLNATHKEIDVLFNNERTSLKAGQLITGRKSISSHLGISESKVQRIIKLFKSEHQIEQQTSNKNRLITILKWKSYQFSEQQNEQPVNNERTTSEQRVNTNKNVKKEKNVKNKEYIGGFNQFILDYPEYKECLNAYKKMRVDMKKKMQPRAETTFINKLKLLIAKGHDGIELVDSAIERNWLSIYEPNSFNKQIPKEIDVPDYMIKKEPKPEVNEADRSELLKKLRGGNE